MLLQKYFDSLPTVTENGNGISGTSAHCSVGEFKFKTRPTRPACDKDVINLFEKMLQATIQKTIEALESENVRGEKAHSHGSALITRDLLIDLSSKLRQAGSMVDTISSSKTRDYTHNTWKVAKLSTEKTLEELIAWAEDSQIRDSRYAYLRKAADVAGLQYGEEDAESILMSSEELFIDVTKPPKAVAVTSYVSVGDNVVSRLEPECRELAKALNAQNSEETVFVLRCMTSRAKTMAKLAQLNLPKPEISAHPAWECRGVPASILSGVSEFDADLNCYLNFEVFQNRIRYFLAILPEVAFSRDFVRRVCQENSRTQDENNELQPQDFIQIAKTVLKGVSEAPVNFQTEKSRPTSGLYFIKSDNKDDETAPLVGKFDHWEQQECLHFVKLVRNQYVFNQLLKSCFPLHPDAFVAKSFENQRKPVLFSAEVTVSNNSLLVLVDGEVPVSIYFYHERLSVEVLQKYDQIDPGVLSELSVSATKVLKKSLSVPPVVHLCVSILSSIQPSSSKDDPELMELLEEF